MVLERMIDAARQRAAARKRRAAEQAQATLMARLQEMMELAASQFGSAFMELSQAGLIAGGSLTIDATSIPPLVTPALRIATSPERIFLLYDWDKNTWALVRNEAAARMISSSEESASHNDRISVPIVSNDPSESGDHLLLAIDELLKRISEQSSGTAS